MPWTENVIECRPVLEEQWTGYKRGKLINTSRTHASDKHESGHRRAAETPENKEELEQQQHQQKIKEMG